MTNIKKQEAPMVTKVDVHKVGQTMEVVSDRQYGVQFYIHGVTIAREWANATARVGAFKLRCLHPRLQSSLQSPLFIKFL